MCSSEVRRARTERPRTGSEAPTALEAGLRRTAGPTPPPAAGRADLRSTDRRRRTDGSRGRARAVRNVRPVINPSAIDPAPPTAAPPTAAPLTAAPRSAAPATMTPVPIVREAGPGWTGKTVPGRRINRLGMNIASAPADLRSSEGNSPTVFGPLRVARPATHSGRSRTVVSGRMTVPAVTRTRIPTADGPGQTMRLAPMDNGRGPTGPVPPGTGRPRSAIGVRRVLSIGRAAVDAKNSTVNQGRGIGTSIGPVRAPDRFDPPPTSVVTRARVSRQMPGRGRPGPSDPNVRRHRIVLPDRSDPNPLSVSPARSGRRSQAGPHGTQPLDLRGGIDPLVATARSRPDTGVRRLVRTSTRVRNGVSRIVGRVFGRTRSANAGPTSRSGPIRGSSTPRSGAISVG